MMFGVFWKQYSKVEQTDESSDGGNPPWNEKLEKKTHLSRRTYLPWLLHFVVIFAYSIIIFVHHPSSQTCSPCFNENLLGAPIVWEDRTFTTNAYENNSDPYSRHNPDVDLIWNDAIEYKILVINEEEKQKLPGGADSAKAYGGEEGYAVGIEMFHQLHCLNHLREFFWKGNRAGEVVFDPGDHADHCFSYLFQTLLCFADVELTTQTWTPEANLYQPTWNLTKQCRNPKVIKEWQGSREAKYHPKGHRIEN